MTPLAWGRRVAPAFRAIADGLGCDPNWLMACMAFESAGTFRADVKNGAGSGAIGLIQFMPQTAGALDQLDYVDAYFRSWRGRMHNLGDVYMPILWPDGVGKADASIIGTVALDVAQAAYRATLANFESGLVALASAITGAGGLKTVATLVVDAAETAVAAAA